MATKDSKTTIAELEAAVAKARQALAATEAARAELLVATEPTSDMQAELKRVQELQNKTAAFERVITAQRRELEQAQADLFAAKGPILRAELAQVEAKAQAALDGIAALLWKAIEATSILEETQNRASNLRYALGEPGYGSQTPQVAQLFAVRMGAAGLLQDLGQATIASGANGIEIVSAKVTAERNKESAKQHAAQVAADEKRRKRERERERIQMYGRE